MIRNHSFYGADVAGAAAGPGRDLADGSIARSEDGENKKQQYASDHYRQTGRVMYQRNVLKISAISKSL